jgi:hypothetical protein
LRTLAAWAPFRCEPPLASDEKISQYRSTSHCSMRLAGAIVRAGLVVGVKVFGSGRNQVWM